MGIRFSALQLLGKYSLGSTIVLLVAFSGCDAGPNSSEVSSNAFIAPTSTGAQVTALAKKLDFLRAIDPFTLDADLKKIPTEAYVLGSLSQHDGNVPEDPDRKNVTKVDDLLVYESNSRSLLSVNTCPPDANGVQCTHASVRLNYDAGGIDEEQSNQGGLTQSGVISVAVPSIQLSNGWILSYDSTSRSIVAFREETPRTVALPAGGTTVVSYRPFAQKPIQERDKKNFGMGNGLVLSLVISGQELAREIRKASQPIVTRFFEIEPNKVVLFFSTERDLHLLELYEEEVSTVFDLSLPEVRLPLIFLRGKAKLFQADPGNEQSPANLPFMSFTYLSENFTGDAEVKIDKFQPVLVPPTQFIDPDTGKTFKQESGLVFEQKTTQFLKILAYRKLNPDTGKPEGDIIAGLAAQAITSDSILGVLQEGAGTTVITPPLTFAGAFHHQRNPMICMFEEKTNNCLAYSYYNAVGENISLFVRSTSVLMPRYSSGPPPAISPNEPALTFAVKDVDDNRLAFDLGVRALVTFNYTSGAVVVVTTNDVITAITGLSLANLTYILPLDVQRVRAFDTQSNTLLSFQLEYLPFPIRVE